MSHIAVAIARFDDEGPYMRARTRAVAHDFAILGEWCPYPPKGIPALPGTGRIVWTVAITGIIGAISLFALACATTYAYPFDSGGRPLFSWQTFLIPATEFLALAGAIGGVVALFVMARLTRLNHPAFDFEEMLHASRDSFVLALACDTEDNANAAIALLAETGAVHTRLVDS